MFMKMELSGSTK